MSRHHLRATILTASLGLAAALPASAAAAAATTPPASLAAAPAPARPTVNMSLNEAVNLALTKGFEVKLQNISLSNSKESYNSAKLEYKPTMSLSAAANGSQSAATGSSVAAGDHVDSQSITAQVSQKIPTGAVVSLTQQFLSRANTANSPTTPSYGRSLTLSISQPLLRGFGSKINLTSLRNSKVSLDSAYLNYKTFLISTVLNVENAYTSLITARENVRISRQSLALAKQTFDEQKTRSDAGLVTPINLYQAESQFITSQNQLSRNEVNLSNAEDNLRLLLGGGEYNVGIIPTDDLSAENLAIPTVESSYRLALDNGADYQSRLYNVQTAQASLAVSKDNTRPTVNLTGSVTTSDNGVATWGSSYHKISENSNYGWTLGLTVNVPLGDRSDKINYRRALSTLDQAKLQLDQFKESTLVQVRSAVNTVKTSQDAVTLSTRNVELSRLTYEADKKRFEVGAITIRTLNDSQNSYDTAEFNLVQAKLTLRNAVNSLRRIENSTLDRYSIKLPE